MLNILVKDICYKMRAGIKNFNCCDTACGRCKCTRGISIHMLALVCRMCDATIAFQIQLCSKDATYYLAMYDGGQKIFPVFKDEIGSGPCEIAGFFGCDRINDEDEYYISLIGLPVKTETVSYYSSLLQKMQPKSSGWHASENLRRYYCVRELILRNRNMSFSDYSSAITNGLLILFPNIWELTCSKLDKKDFILFLSKFSPALQYLSEICGRVSKIFSEYGSVGRSAFWTQMGEPSIDQFVSLLAEDTEKSEKYREVLRKICRYIIEGNMRSVWEKIDQQIGHLDCINDTVKEAVKTLRQMPVCRSGKYRNVFY